MSGPLKLTFRRPSRFGRPVTESQITAAQKDSKSTNWAVNVWRDWSEYRKQTWSAPDGHPPHILTCQVSEPNNWLCRFVLEVRRKVGKPYPPSTLHQLCCGILHYVRDINPTRFRCGNFAHAHLARSSPNSTGKLTKFNWEAH